MKHGRQVRNATRPDCYAQTLRSLPLASPSMQLPHAEPRALAANSFEAEKAFRACPGRAGGVLNLPEMAEVLVAGDLHAPERRRNVATRAAQPAASGRSAIRDPRKSVATSLWTDRADKLAACRYDEHFCRRPSTSLSSAVSRSRKSLTSSRRKVISSCWWTMRSYSAAASRTAASNSSGCQGFLRNL